MVFRFRLLGGITLEGPSGPLTGPAAQRHRLALLAVIATSRQPVTRDKLLGLLWPDRDPEPARQLLNQAVHAIRRAVAADSIVSAGEELQFNPARVRCDVVEFEEALAMQDRMQAVGLYRGPFLDGFFLSESPEFERWVERERDRLAASFHRALENLADREEQAGDPAAAAEWWKQLAAQDPYDSRIVLRLMHALAAVGNRAGALQYGLTHQQRLRQELEIDAVPEVLALIEQLRREPAGATRSHREAGRPAAPARESGSERLPPAPPAAWPRRSLLAALVLLAVAAGWNMTRLLPGPVSRPASPQPAAVDEIARAVARELSRREQGSTGSTPPGLRTGNIAAYELYLRGNDPASIRSDSTARKALDYFRRAVELDSNYAAAWAGVARLTYRVGSGKQAHDQSEAAARKALTLDDSLGEAHAILARHRTMVADFRGAEYHFGRAIALEPNQARHREWRARYLLETGRPAEALAESERALALEPLSPTAAAEVARALIAHDRCDEALARLEPLMALDPPPLRVPPLVVHCYARQGRWVEAIALTQPRVEEGDLRALAMIGYLKGRAGQRDDAHGIQAQLETHWRAGRLDAYLLAWVPAALGDLDQAFAWLDRSLKEPVRDFPGPLWTARFLDPPFDDLRRDGRLEAFRRRLDPQN